MKFDVTTKSIGTLRAPVLILLGTEETRLARAATSAGASMGAAYRTLNASGAFTGKEGQLRTITGAPSSRIPHLVVAGLGERRHVTPETIVKAMGRAIREVRALHATSCTVHMATERGKAFQPARQAQAIMEGALLGHYRFGAYKQGNGDQAVESLFVRTSRDHKAKAQRGGTRGQIYGDAVCVARDLGNEPGNTATPLYLAARAKSICEDEGLTYSEFDEARMLELGMGSFMGVSQGSDEPGRMIFMTYEPKTKGRVPTIAFVGKGITFDTGGISIKPGAKLEDMKFDMCGAAAVIGGMQAIARLRPSVRVVGIVSAAENMPSARAYKPGDILRASDGTTIEVRNTDAEGRLVLADALAYATTKLRPKPKAIFDLATLTGACVMALGAGHAALVSNDDGLVDRTERASASSGDDIWRMPLGKVYRDQLKSPYADVSNLGTSGAGLITAAAFLEKFTHGVPWAHLDIAGMAWGAADSGINTPGASGFGVRLLADLASGWSKG